MSKSNVPRYKDLISPVFIALKDLGGSGTNDEIHEQVILNLNLSPDIIDEPHLGSITQTELSYQLAWARTYLKNFGAIENRGKSLWAITKEFSKTSSVDYKAVIKNIKPTNNISNKASNSQLPIMAIVDQNWQDKVMIVLLEIDPFAFERLTQRLLRECGFEDVKVTKKSGDGGIDGTGKLKINGIFSFNIAFQCKRYKGSVTSSEIRNFRGSLSTDIEKGVFITTGTFSRDAEIEASTPGKQQIDLINGKDFVDKLAEFKVGLTEVKSYEIDFDFFRSI